MRHGPHHVAQKSTTVSPSCCSTSLLEVRVGHCHLRSTSLRSPRRRLPGSAPRIRIQRRQPLLTSATDHDRHPSPRHAHRPHRHRRRARSTRSCPSTATCSACPRSRSTTPTARASPASPPANRSSSCSRPRSADTPIGKFVAKRGPGIHHICFAVDDLDGTLARCRAGRRPAHRRGAAPRRRREAHRVPAPERHRWRARRAHRAADALDWRRCYLLAEIADGLHVAAANVPAIRRAREQEVRSCAREFPSSGRRSASARRRPRRRR